MHESHVLAYAQKVSFFNGNNHHQNRFCTFCCTLFGCCWLIARLTVCGADGRPVDDESHGASPADGGRAGGLHVCRMHCDEGHAAAKVTFVGGGGGVVLVK